MNQEAQLPYADKPSNLPDVESEIPEEATQHTHKSRNSMIMRIAPMAASALLGLGTASSARANAFSQSRSEVAQSLEASSEVDPIHYTYDYFKSMESGKIGFGYFNGIVVLDSQVQYYHFMDPLLRGVDSKVTAVWLPPADKYGNNSNLKNGNSGKFGAGREPAVLIDSKGTTWLCISLLSKNFIGITGPENSSSLVGQSDPTGVTRERVFIPLDKANMPHLKFYKFKLGAGNKPAPAFLAGGIDSNQDFAVLTPGYDFPPEYQAAWELYKEVTLNPPGETPYKAPTDQNIDGPYFESNAKLKSFLAGYETVPYSMPSSKSVKTLINKAYIGHGG